MGLDHNAKGDWEVLRNRVPAGLVHAARVSRIKSERRSVTRSGSTNTEQSRRMSETRIKRESTEDCDDVYGADDGDVEMEDVWMVADRMVT